MQRAERLCQGVGDRRCPRGDERGEARGTVLRYGATVNQRKLTDRYTSEEIESMNRTMHRALNRARESRMLWLADMTSWHETFCKCEWCEELRKA